MTTKDYFSNPPQPISHDLTGANEWLAQVEEKYGELTSEEWHTYDGWVTGRNFYQKDHDFRFYVTHYVFGVTMPGADFYLFAFYDDSGTPEELIAACEAEVKQQSRKESKK